jgi:hypothetical protein
MEGPQSETLRLTQKMLDVAEKAMGNVHVKQPEPGAQRRPSRRPSVLDGVPAKEKTDDDEKEFVDL